MNTMATLMGVSLIASVFMTLVPIALLVALQVWLCKKSKWLGLILPALSLSLSLLLTLSIPASTSMGSGTLTLYENGQLVQEHHVEAEHPRLTPGAMGAIASMFLLANIPTVAFGGIWLHYKNRRDFQDDLQKMKIEDLE